MSTTKNSGKTSQQQQQTASGVSSATPNNLGALQTGWNIADNLVNANAPAGQNAVGNGLALTTTGANAASGAATAGLNTALNIGNGNNTNAANGYLTPFANGSMSGNNPNFQAVLDQFSRGAQSATDGNFAASGRYGSGANANAFNSAVANKAGDLSYQNYGDSLTRQLQASGQLSANNIASGQQQLTALDLINGLGATATGAGGALTAAGNNPALTFAQIIQALGAGGGTGTTSQTSSGTASGKSSSTSTTIDPAKAFGEMFNPLSFF